MVKVACLAAHSQIEFENEQAGNEQMIELKKQTKQSFASKSVPKRSLGTSKWGTSKKGQGKVSERQTHISDRRSQNVLVPKPQPAESIIV